LLCPKECNLHGNKAGFCLVRTVKDNKVVSLAYGNPCYVGEVKPESISLYHFKPGSTALMVGTAGCNLTCMNCPVSHVSQKDPDEVVTQSLSPEEVIATCKKKSINTIIFGYSEPVVFFEYMLAIAKLANQNNIQTILSSSGYISDEPMRELSNYLNGAVIDIKAFSDEGYHKLSGGSIFPVFNTLKILKEKNIWFEITHKIIPGYTDNLDLTKEMCKWMVENNYASVPVHFNVFKPVYKLTQTPETPIEKITQSIEIAKTAGLAFVYTNHEAIKTGKITHCPKCKKTVLNRVSGKIKTGTLKGKKCGACGSEISGIW